MLDLGPVYDQIRQDAVWELARRGGFEVDGHDLVLTREQEEREFGTVEKLAEPFVNRVLDGGDP